MTRKQATTLLISTLFLLGAGSGWSAEPTDTHDSEQQLIETIARVKPSVVLVAVEGFHVNKETSSVTDVRASGSGFAIAPGEVVTNYHVVEFARKIQVTTTRGMTVSAKIVGTAPEFDLALLSVPLTIESLPPLELHEGSPVQAGRTVLAVSYPFGLQSSVSRGIVSGVGRELPGLDVGSNLIQFDAPINPGQSGGPLINVKGHLLGVTTAKIRGAEAMGFAIPTEVLTRVAPDLRTMGHPFRPELGMSGTTVNHDLAKLLGLPVEWGVLVESVDEGSAADEIGLEAGLRHLVLGGRDWTLGGDIIVGFDQVPVESAFDLDQLLLQARPGEQVEIAVVGPEGPRKIMLVVPHMRH